MTTKTSIEWTESTWNPVTGCSKISPGCKHCYAERMANRLAAMGMHKYRNGFNVTLHPNLISEPLSWKKPRRVFVNSMSDLFHEEVPLSFIKQVFEAMNVSRQHQFQILTKRAERLAEIAQELKWTDNIWMGVTVENADYLYRIKCLKQTKAKVKFLSIEPLLGPLGIFNLKGLDWIIVGGESGPHARPIQEKWVLDIRNQCLEAGVPFFFKQWGGVFKKKAGRVLENKIWDEMPVLANF